jgi:hypothetical protein
MRKLLLSIGFLVTVNLATGTDLYVTYTQGLYSASASFVMSGSNLVITMENVANPANVTGNTYILSGIFFDSTGAVAPNLAEPQTAYIDDATNVKNRWDVSTYTPNSTDVGSQWAFKFLSGGFTPVPYSPHYGIASAGFSALGGGFSFGTGDIMDPAAYPWSGIGPDGGDFGLVPVGFTGYGNANPSYSPLIMGPVHFVLSVPEGFDPATAISKIVFAYGTGPDYFLVPEPGVVGSLSLLLAGLGLYLQRRKKTT